MTKFETREAAIQAARATMIAAGFPKGDGYVIDYVPGYWNGREFTPGYYKAFCATDPRTSNARLI